MTKPTFTIGVFATIFDDKKRVLLCHRTDHDLWNLPGGVLEHGEAPWDGLIREVKEETGLDVEIKRFSGIYSKSDEDEIVLQFECEITEGNIILNDEADKIEYFDVNNLPKNTVPHQAIEIKKTLENPNIFLMKKHEDGLLSKLHKLIQGL